MISHSDAVKKAMLTLSALGCRHVERRDVGLFYDKRGNPRHIGTKGEADVRAVAPHGRSVAVEIKTGDARRNTDQKRWGASFVQAGGIYVVARYTDTQDAAETIRAALQLAAQNAVA